MSLPDLLIGSTSAYVVGAPKPKIINIALLLTLLTVTLLTIGCQMNVNKLSGGPAVMSETARLGRADSLVVPEPTDKPEPPPIPTPESTPEPAVDTALSGQMRYIADTGGLGVRVRSECGDNTQRSAGWAESTAVTITYAREDCPGWLYVQRSSSESSWVRDRHLSITVPTPTPLPLSVSGGMALALTTSAVVRSTPSTQTGAVVRRLRHLEEITILGSVVGEQWIVGDQTWPMAPPSWTRTWYQVEGGYVYSAWVFIPRPNEGSPLIQASAARVINVSLSAQRLTASVGDAVVYTTGVTTGKQGYETPTGTYALSPSGRVINETMTSAQAAIDDPAEEYHVKNVLYTQYFDRAGDAFHLNYWQPDSVFGGYPTSHGCIGLRLHDAQWLWLFVQSGTTLTISD